ncbi:4-hydroxybenzoate hydroxylase [Scytonema sp. HK-05]|uniref:4-hydroxybenzoate 3-monooxygenase n=1 Tax=Scytonema sp. HK-05 TaxID=1137095 RepID=UPI000937687C|nr:4-hydroxybenzoate 3-monooxygenase [Scytonema sp. HK-05]OKH59066.1 FAD-dependent oxidoreductase [Scytonema sp. HK-05]BAY48757.1 4-hydroxybenzoate hydroxylase [Scytonema sp. HK-05]
MNDETALKTSVCILGSGPAGIVLGNILLQNGIDCIVIDRYNREEIYARGRAGAIESTTIALLKKHGLADTILLKGYPHDRCEFRYPDDSFVLEYGKLSDGDVHYFYPQSDLNEDLIQKYLDTGGQILFHHQGIQLTQSDDGIIVECENKNTDTTLKIQADFVAGCDGYHGLARQSVPAEAAKIYTKEYGYRWLAILADAPPASSHTLYGVHPEGFAAYMRRNSHISRYYLQISAHDQLTDWSDERVWRSLHQRLAKPLTQGKIMQKQIMVLRNYVIEPLRYQRLLLAGDAAHIITPMGGKGLNLAVQDAGVLAETLIGYYLENHDLSYLDRYSEIRLPYIWQAQEFSYSLLNMVHLPEGSNPEDVDFLHKLSASKLAQLRTSTTFAKNFARNYVGIV